MCNLSEGGVAIGWINLPSGNQKRFWRDDPEQAALIGARIGRRNTGQLSTPRIKAVPLSRTS